MTETNNEYDNDFHRRYVNGEGEVVEKPITSLRRGRAESTFEDVLKEYRWYVNDPDAELPEEIVKMLAACGKI